MQAERDLRIRSGRNLTEVELRELGQSFLELCDQYALGLHKDPPKFIFQREPFSIEQFCPIIPTRNLWGFIGTMIFAGWRARCLMKLGYCDALRRLETVAKMRSPTVTHWRG
jgi:hypothetical protein